MYNALPILKAGLFLFSISIFTTAPAQITKTEQAKTVHISAQQLPWMHAELRTQEAVKQAKMDWIEAHPAEYQQDLNCPKPLQIEEKALRGLCPERQTMLQRQQCRATTTR